MKNHSPLRHVPSLPFYALVITLLFMPAGPAWGDVVKTVSKEYYMVEGTDIRSIYNYLKNHSPMNKGTKTYQAHTRTKIRYNYKWRNRNGECTIEYVRVNLHLIYKYPKLVHSVDYKTRRWWKTFIEKLTVHEEVHGQISTKAAHELDDLLERLGPQGCDNFRERVRQKANVVIEKMNQRQRDYDKLTEHGLKQERNIGQFP